MASHQGLSLLQASVLFILTSAMAAGAASQAGPQGNSRAPTRTANERFRLIDFGADDGGPLMSGSIPRFVGDFALTTAGPNWGAAVLDTHTGTPQRAGQLGNVVLLQGDPTRKDPRTFADPRPNDAAGELGFAFFRPVRPASLKLVDLGEGPDATIEVVVGDRRGATRTYSIPPGWVSGTGSVVLAARELRLDSLAPQAGAHGAATASEQEGFVQGEVVEIRVRLSGPAAVDDLAYHVPTGGEIQLVASTTAFLTNEQTEVRFQAAIPPVPGLVRGSPTIQLVDEAGSPIGGPLAALLDSGALEDGDDIAGDGVYSCFLTLVESQPSTLRIRAQALVVNQPLFASAGALLRSDPVLLEAVDPLSSASADIIVQVQNTARGIWEDSLASFGDTLTARLEAAQGIRALAGVSDAGVSSDEVTIWIHYESGVKGGLLLNPVGTRGESGADRSSMARDVPDAFVAPPARFVLGGHGASELLGDDPVPIGNNKVLVWDAYNSQFAPFDEGPDLRDLFEGSECPDFDVTYLVDGQATVGSVDAFTNYATIVLVTHGAVDGDGQVVFLTREPVTLGSLLFHAIDLVLGRITVMGDVFAIRPGFIRALPGAFEDGLLYNGSCQSSANSTMINAFFSKGVLVAQGYTRVVNSNFAQSTANQLFASLVTDQANAGDAFAQVSPKVDPTPPNATFTQTGLLDLRYSGAFRNGSFEDGLETWSVDGDGRSITSLGSVGPTGGGRMAIISTGLGFTEVSGAIEQSFCLAEDTASIEFDWQFLSEEFVEWCGPDHPFDDPFVVELETDDGLTVLLSETVDSLCGSVFPTSLFFDQGGPDCEVDGGGIGEGGNDCTVWSTGWRHAVIDVSAIAALNQGKGVKLRFRNFDEGDSIFDSAVLIDQVEIVPSP